MDNFLVKQSFEKDTFVILARLCRHATYGYYTTVHIYKYGNIALKVLFTLHEMLHIANIFVMVVHLFCRKSLTMP